MNDLSFGDSADAHSDIPSQGERRSLLRADCANCFGLCCVALGFSRSADFARDKPVGEPCVNLGSDFGCGIHSRLLTSGYRGCTVFECFGAGQKVAQSTFGGTSWRDDPTTRQQMFAVFPVMRELHELLYFLGEGLELSTDANLTTALAGLYRSITRLTALTAEEVLRITGEPGYVGELRAAVGELLAQVSTTVRKNILAVDAPRTGDAASTPHPTAAVAKRVRPGADLSGARLAGLDLRGANLRGSYLIRADLRRADLGAVDLLGADLRDADIRNTELRSSLFLSQAQLQSARGNQATQIPAHLEYPAHWGAQ